MTDARWSITGVLDGRLRTRPGAVYPELADDSGAIARSLDADGLLPMSIGAFLLSGPGGRLVLVDAGAGESFELRADVGEVDACGLLPAQLARLGVAPADVGDVVFSHLHHDHVGWSAYFPNATYWCHAGDRAAITDDVRVTRALAPVGDRIRSWDRDFDLHPGIRLWHTPGHTAGSACVLVDATGGPTVLVGDVVHHPVEFAVSVTGSGDTDAELASATRRSLAGRLRASGIAVRGPHFPDLDCDLIITGESDA